MSAVTALALGALRARLTFALDRKDDTGFRTGVSLYLAVLGCCYLASDNDTAEETLALENLYQEQAAVEQADGDALLTTLLLVEVLS